jgi:hypothetical protein
LAQAKGVNCLNTRGREIKFYFHSINMGAASAAPDSLWRVGAAQRGCKII